MKILLLGANGNLGQAFVKVCQMNELHAWDIEDLDITDEKEVIEKITKVEPSVIINCAAYNQVDKAEEEKEIAIKLNSDAVGYIASVANDLNAVFVHFSTNYVFDGEKDDGYNEDDIPNPQSTYARSKLLGEEKQRENCTKYYLIRTQWLYGEQSQNGKKSFPDIMLELCNAGKKISAVNDEYGQPTYVKDVADAVMKLVNEKYPFGIYHFTNSGKATWFEWAKKIFEIKYTSANLVPIGRADFVRPAPRPQFGILNNTKFPPLRPWEEALKEFLS